MSERSHGRQMLASLVVAVVIVAVVIAAVTASLGPTSVAELEAREDRLRFLEEQREERRRLREERREQRRERREERLQSAADPTRSDTLVAGA